MLRNSQNLMEMRLRNGILIKEFDENLGRILEKSKGLVQRIACYKGDLISLAIDNFSYEKQVYK